MASAGPEWVRVQKLEAAILRNAEDRGTQDASKFLDSELALEAEIRSFAAGPASVEPLLVDLLGHDNPDIAQTVITVLSELVDPERTDQEKAATNADALINKTEFVGLLRAHVARLDDYGKQADYEAVTECLELISTLLELGVTVTKLEPLLQLLLTKLATRFQGNMVDSNALHIADIVADVALASGASYLAQPQCMEKLLTALAHHQNEPKFVSSEQKEFLMSVADTVAAALLVDRTAFDALNGMTTIMTFFNSQKELWPVALKVLPEACGGSSEAAHVFVTHQGLGHLFPLLSLCVKKKRFKHVEELTSVVAALLRAAAPDDRTRVCNKLTERGLEKLKVMLDQVPHWVESTQTVDEALCETIGYTHLLPFDQFWDSATTSEQIELEIKEAEAALQPTDLAIENSVHDAKCDSANHGYFTILVNVIATAVAVAAFGNRKLAATVHHMCDGQMAAMDRCVVEHTYFAHEVTELTEAYREFRARHAEMLGAAAELLAQLEEATSMLLAEPASQTAKNRETRQRHKIRRMDAEMRRQQRVEDRRYANRH